MCCGIYIALVNKKLAKNATMDPALFLVLQLKNHHLYSCAGVDKKRLRWHRHINAFFGLKTDYNQKSVNLGKTGARHTTNR